MFSGSGDGPPSGNNGDPQSPVFTIFAEGWNDLFANYPNFETSLNIGTRTDKLEGLNILIVILRVYAVSCQPS